MAEKGLFCGINRPADLNNLNEQERKHTPVIKCPVEVKSGEPFDVEIQVSHGMEEAHHIQSIELYSGQNFHARVDLTPAFTNPKISVQVVKSGKHAKHTLRALARCNMHGQWEATREISVIE